MTSGQILYWAFASSAFQITLRDRAHTLTAELKLTPVSGRWLVAALTPPDLDTILAPTPPAIPQPAGSGSAEHAARAFIGGYLAWLYRQARLRAVTAATGMLLAGLRAHPPRVPPTTALLRPKVAAIAMQPHGSAWRALLNITDGRETYELVLTIAYARGRSLVSRISSPQ